MKKLIIISFLLVAACSKSGDSAEAPKNPPIPKPTPPREGGDGKNTPIPNPGTPPQGSTPGTPPAPPKGPSDPWPTKPQPPPPPPLPNQSNVQANVVWDCKNENTGSSVQINGYINDSERRLYMRLKGAAPVILRDEQYSSSEKGTKYCLPQNGAEKTEWVLEIRDSLTTKNKTSQALLTHYRNLTSFPDCSGKIDSDADYDIRDGLTCTRSEQAFINPDASKNPVPVDVIKKTELPENWTPSVRTASKSISGYTYLLVDNSRESGKIQSRVMRLNRDLSRDVNFGTNGIMLPTLPPLDMGADSMFETYQIAPDSSDGFFLYGRLDQSTDVFVAHFGANGQLKKDFISTGFVRLSSMKDTDFYRSMVFSGQALVVAWDGSYAVINSSGVTKRINNESNPEIRTIYDLSISQAAEPQIFMTVSDRNSCATVLRMDKNGNRFGSASPCLDNPTSHQKNWVLRTVPALDNSFYVVNQEDKTYYNYGNIIHIRRYSKNNAPDTRFNVKVTLPIGSARSFNSDSHDGRFAVMSDNSLLVLTGYIGSVSGTEQLGVVKIDTFGNMSRSDTPDFRASIGMQGFNFYENSGQVLLTDESGQMYSLGTYGSTTDRSIRAFSLKLNQ